MDEQTPAERQAEEGENMAGYLRCTAPLAPEPGTARHAPDNPAEHVRREHIVRGGFDLGVRVIIERHAQL